MRRGRGFSLAEEVSAPAGAGVGARRIARWWGLGLAMAGAFAVGSALGAWPVTGATGGLRAFAAAMLREPFRELQVFLILATGGALAAWAYREVVGAKEDRPGSWKRTGAVLLATAAIAFVLTFVPACVVAYRLGAAVSAADRLDPRWRYADVWADRPAIPDAENAARVVAEADAQIGRARPSRPSASVVPGSGDVLNIGAGDPLSRFQDGRIDAEQGGERGKLPGEIAASLRAGLAEVPQAVAIARGLADMDRGRDDLTPAANPRDTLLPGVQRARSVAALLSADAALAADAGDIDAALRSCRAMLGAACAIGDEPAIVSQLARRAIVRDAMRAVRRSLNHGEASDAALAAIQAALQAEREHSAARLAIRGERATDDETLRLAGVGALGPDELGIGAWPPPRVKGRTALLSPFWSFWCANERASLLEGSNELLAVLDRPEPEWMGATVDPPPGISQAASGEWLPPPFAAPALVRMRRALASHLLLRAELGALIVLVAAERGRLASGEWPISVDEIGKGLLLERPIDPFSGKPYILGNPEGTLEVYWPGPDIGEVPEGDERNWGGPMASFTLAEPGRRGVAAPKPDEEPDWPGGSMMSVPGRMRRIRPSGPILP